MSNVHLDDMNLILDCDVKNRVFLGNSWRNILPSRIFGWQHHRCSLRPRRLRRRQEMGKWSRNECDGSSNSARTQEVSLGTEDQERSGGKRCLDEIRNIIPCGRPEANACNQCEQRVSAEDPNPHEELQRGADTVTSTVHCLEAFVVAVKLDPDENFEYQQNAHNNGARRRHYIHNTQIDRAVEQVSRTRHGLWIQGSKDDHSDREAQQEDIWTG